MDSSFNPNSDWDTFDNVLKEKGIPRQIIIYPERYMDQYNVTRRKGAIKALGKVMNREQLEDCLPFTWRYIRDTISNGNEPEFPGFAQKEADVSADNGSQTDGA